MNYIKRIVNNSVVAAILAIFAVVSVAAAVYINVSASSIESTQNNRETATTNEHDTQIVESTSVLTRESHEEQLNQALSGLKQLANPNKRKTDIIDKYIELRYNYTDSPDKQKILSGLTNITNKSFLGQVDNSLNYLTGDSHAAVIKRYSTTYQSSYDNALDNLIYIVDINGENKVIEYTLFNEANKWVIYNEREIDTVSDEDIETEELLTPNEKPSKEDEDE